MALGSTIAHTRIMVGYDTSYSDIYLINTADGAASRC